MCKWKGNLNARKLFEEYKVPSDEEIEDAFRFFWINRHSFSGLNRNFHGFQFTKKGNHHREWETNLR